MENIEVPYLGSKRSYSVWLKDALPVIVDLLEDANLGPELVFYPRRVFLHQGGKTIRVWDEEWDGNDWWEIQVWSLQSLK